MSYATRQDALDNWRPKSAKTLIDRPDFVIYTWLGMLYVLAIFPMGGSYHVSVDLNLNIEQLKEMLK